MENNIQKFETLLKCECGTPAHQFIVTHFKGDEEIYFEVHLTPINSFWKRLKYGLRYIMGKQSIYGAFEEVVISKERFLNLLKDVETKVG